MLACWWRFINMGQIRTATPKQQMLANKNCNSRKEKHMFLPIDIERSRCRMMNMLNIPAVFLISSIVLFTTSCHTYNVGASSRSMWTPTWWRTPKKHCTTALCWDNAFGLRGAVGLTSVGRRFDVGLTSVWLGHYGFLMVFVGVAVQLLFFLSPSIHPESVHPLVFSEWFYVYLTIHLP